MKILAFIFIFAAFFSLSAQLDEMEMIKKEIKKKQIEKVNAETEAQNLLPANWEEYSKKIKEVELLDEQIHSLEKKQEQLKSDKSKVTNES